MRSELILKVANKFATEFSDRTFKVSEVSIIGPNKAHNCYTDIQLLNGEQYTVTKNEEQIKVLLALDQNIAPTQWTWLKYKGEL